MTISVMTKIHIDSCLKLFNQIAQTDDFLYKCLDKESFEKKFLPHKTDTYETLSFVYVTDNVIKGFISGVIYPERQKIYITMILVDPKFRRQHIGTKLLNYFEIFIKESYHVYRNIDLVFFNPVILSWIIPNTNDHDHPNSPGVDINSVAYLFFKALGYQTFALQNSYYKDIRNYKYSKEIISILDNLKDKQINIVYANQNHQGFDELFNDLGNPLWKKEINISITGDKPVIIAEINNQMIGFTGPLAVEHSLRGYFTGIGVHSKYRGLGIGKALFSSLCLHLNEIGAHYMTLFTGENNSARKIYEQEGFKIVRSWADMRKDL